MPKLSWRVKNFAADRRPVEIERRTKRMVSVCRIIPEYDGKVLKVAEGKGPHIDPRLIAPPGQPVWESSK